MGLQEQHIAYKFAGGVETKMDSKAVPETRLLALENGVFTKAISIQKRNGYEAFSKIVDGTVTPLADAKRLAVRDNELLLLTTNKSYSRQDDTDQWVAMGSIIRATATERPAVQTGSQQTMPDHATKSGISVFAWEDSRGGVYWTVRDATTGAIYRDDTATSSDARSPRCLAVGSLLHIYYALPTTNKIMVLVINPGTPSAAVTATVLVDDLDTTNPHYDACATTRTSSEALIAWHENATSNFRVGYVAPAGILGSPGTGYPSVYRETFGIAVDAPIAVAYHAGATDVLGEIAVVSINTLAPLIITYSAGNSSTAIASVGQALTGSPTVNVQRIAATYDGSVVIAVFEEYAATASQRYCQITDNDAGASSYVRSIGLASRAWTVGDDAFAVFVHDTTYFNTYVTLRLSDLFPVGRHAAGSAGGAPARKHLSSVHVVDSVASLVLPYKTRIASTNNDKFTETAIRLFAIDFDNDNAYQTVQLGKGLYMGGACPMHYDGKAWTEHGFHFGPETVSSAVAAGGSMTAAGVYLYKVWYEWTDSQGEIHRGAESVGTSVTLGGGDSQVTLTLPTLRVTQKERVRICVARSLNGDTGRLFRVTSLDPTTSGAAANGYVANTTSSDTVSFVDRLSDTNLALQEPHYTNGGILSNDPAVVGHVIAGGKNRIFFSDAANGNKIRYSQRIAEGYGLEVTPELYQDVDPLGGDVTALTVMDDVVFVFKASAIFAFNGDGPLENGSTANSSFSPCVLVTTDVGCSDPLSIVQTPTGTMFKSAKGIYMLDRSRQVTYVGAPVEAYNSQTVRRATVMPDRSQIVFLTDSGSSLLYDYLFNQWSTFTNHEGYDSIVVDSQYHYLRTDDTVYRETLGEYSDAGSRITLRLETSWLHLYHHLQGFQRFWSLLLLGTWVSPHQLGIQYRLDYNDAWTSAEWLDATDDTSGTGWLSGEGVHEVGLDPMGGTDYGEGIYGGSTYGGDSADIYQWRFGIHENGQSIQFRFEDFEKSGLTGASFELTEMTIVGGVKKLDVRPFPTTRSA